MRLYASGFNAHGQLKDTSGVEDTDVPVFEVISSGEQIKILFACWSETILFLDGEIHRLGGRTGGAEAPSSKINYPDQQHHILTNFFGTHDGLYGAISENGRLYRLQDDDNDDDDDNNKSTGSTLRQVGDEKSPRISHVAITSAEHVAVAICRPPSSPKTEVIEFPSVEAFEKWYKAPEPSDLHSPRRFTIPGRVKQLVAGATGFTVLASKGMVFTWGDARHGRCLGRLSDTDQPASKPAAVEALGGVRIAKVMQGGWMSGALSADRDLYLWGLPDPTLGEMVCTLKEADAAEEMAGLVKIPDESDVVDAAIGASHAIIVAADGKKIYVAGRNVNGELGIGRQGSSSSSPAFIPDWAMAESFGDGRAVSVACGAHTSFVMVVGDDGGKEKMPPQDQ